MGIGADRFQIVVHRQQDVRGAGEGRAEAFLDRLDAPALPQVAMTAARPEIGKTQAFQFAQALDLGPQLGLGAGIENIEGEPALSLGHLARAQFNDNGERGNLPHRRVHPRTVEIQFILAVHLCELVFGKAEGGEPVDEVRRKHLGLAVERITGEPYQFFLAEPDRSGVIELGAKLALVDHFGETHMLAPVDDRKGDALVRVKFPDHLQHQQFVKIGIEQAAHDRVEPPSVIVGPACDVCDCHI
ncbi:hypothetical protein GALL_539920 [mine drainage metagenome]|uniref:Uncharacterized protein n=1 Tax=mine drainage metagenome TaxID=410659 RepID=A0A1J5P088_9ZZZZ